MTKRKDEDVKEGFQIPIEDASDELLGNDHEGHFAEKIGETAKEIEEAADVLIGTEKTKK